MRARWSWALAVVVLLRAQTVRAEQPSTAALAAPPATTRSEPPEPPAAAPPAAAPAEHWYGWQILLSDLASLTLGVASQQSIVFGAGYIAAPPLIHVLHGQGTRALASAGMRIG